MSSGQMPSWKYTCPADGGPYITIGTDVVVELQLKRDRPMGDCMAPCYFGIAGAKVIKLTQSIVGMTEHATVLDQYGYLPCGENAGGDARGSHLRDLQAMIQTAPTLGTVIAFVRAEEERLHLFVADARRARAVDPQ